MLQSMIRGLELQVSTAHPMAVIKIVTAIAAQGPDTQAPCNQENSDSFFLATDRHGEERTLFFLFLSGRMLPFRGARVRVGDQVG